MNMNTHISFIQSTPYGPGRALGAGKVDPCLVTGAAGLGRRTAYGYGDQFRHQFDFPRRCSAGYFVVHGNGAGNVDPFLVIGAVGLGRGSADGYGAATDGSGRGK